MNPFRKAHPIKVTITLQPTSEFGFAEEKVYECTNFKIGPMKKRAEFRLLSGSKAVLEVTRPFLRVEVERPRVGLKSGLKAMFARRQK